MGILNAFSRQYVVPELAPIRFRMASGMDSLAVVGDIPPANIVAFSETHPLQGVPVQPDDLRWTPWQA